MEKYSADVVIIGGGAAGLMAAIGAARTFAAESVQESRNNVIVLEKMPRPGRKIMITGKGRCNFTNVKAWNEFSTHIYPKPNFLKPSFYNLPPEKMLDFMQANGMEYIVERGDRAFPASHLSSAVVDTLYGAATEAGAEILCGKEVKEVAKGDEGFRIGCTDGSEYESRKLIICTGGLSYPKTGSSGDGYVWAKKFGHTIKPLFPSLTAIVPKGYKTESGKGHIDRSTPLSELGVSLCGNQLKNVELSISVDGNECMREFGDMDFTDGGIEGAIGFKVSRKCVNALINGSKVTASIDLKPAVEIEELANRIARLWDEISKDKRSARLAYKDRFRILLSKVLPASLIPGFRKCNDGVDHKRLAKALKEWRMEIAGYVGYERCVVTAGGVDLDEVTAKTLESQSVSGLYFAGEILNLDADTGGYNLHTAFSTGYLAGISAAKVK